MVEITSEEQNKVKRIKRTEDSLRDLCNNIKYTNIRITGVPEEEEEKKGYEKIFEEIVVENFPNMEKEIANQVQEAQRVPYRINKRRNMPRKWKPTPVFLPGESQGRGSLVGCHLWGRTESDTTERLN